MGCTVARVVLVVALLGPGGAVGQPAEADACASAYAAREWKAALKSCAVLAEKGDGPALVRLGLMHANGLGISRDDAAAVRLFRLAAERGHAEGELMLGSMYAAGEGGLKRDHQEAGRWFARAAEQGFAQGQLRLALAYRDGAGVPQDEATAYFWLTLAVGGLTGAQRNRAVEARERLRSRLSQSQHEEAVRAAREWKPAKERSGASAPQR